MKMTTIRKATLVLMMALLSCAMMSACVSKKKYRELDANRVACEQRESDLKKQLSETEAKSSELEKDVKEANAEIEQTKALLDNTGMARAKLDKELKEKVARIEEREKTIKDLNELIDKQKEVVNKLLNKIKSALVKYDSSQLSVEVKNGKVYVAMSDKLMFQSGSTKIDVNGKEALKQLADVLSKQSDIDILIEGHTDNVPIKSAVFKDNWDLSVFRATEVVRILTDEFKLDKTKLIPSGRGEFSPKADNATEEGRAKNRRTEIILSPNLDELYKLLSA
jgi:chemotaxis protein MotB